jgi:hypothetical protein
VVEVAEVAAETAGAVFVVVVVFVLPVADVPVFGVAVAAVSAVARCIAKGIWTTDSGDVPVSGSTETMLLLSAMLTGFVKLRCTVQSFAVTAGKAKFC